MPKQSKPQKDTVERVMHEFKHGELEMRGGRKVRNPKQAIAIALHEAGASNQESPAKNKENLKRTKAQERKAATRDGGSGPRTASGQKGKTRTELYAEARRRDLPGRSKMSKEQLEKALG